MRIRERRFSTFTSTMLVAALLVLDRAAVPPALAADPPASPAGIRLSMDALHQQGGVPLGWQLTPPRGDIAAGRRAFDELGCASCHRIANETFSNAVTGQGPELTGMGSHHPAAYFVEAILNPDAVLIDAPGYLGPDGRSTMPSYPQLTVGQLGDLVAYLASLQADDSMASCHPAASSSMPAGVTMSRIDVRNRPAPPGDLGGVFFAQTYDVRPGRLADFENWFATKGRRAFTAVPGLVRIDTYVDPARSGSAITSLFVFSDEAALRNFMGDPGSVELWNQFDAFVGRHGHVASDVPLVYRARSLSTE